MTAHTCRFNKCQLEDGQIAKIFGDYLSKLPPLQEIILHRSTVGKLSALAIGRFLEHTTSLSYLDLNETSMNCGYGINLLTIEKIEQLISLGSIPFPSLIKVRETVHGTGIFAKGRIVENMYFYGMNNEGLLSFSRIDSKIFSGYSFPEPGELSVIKAEAISKEIYAEIVQKGWHTTYPLVADILVGKLILNQSLAKLDIATQLLHFPQNRFAPFFAVFSSSNMGHFDA